MLYNIIVGIIAVICFLLIVVVLLQPGQGQGISGMGGGSIGGGGGLGARRTADLLSKSTTILAGLFLGLCVLANFAIDRGQANNRSILQEGAPGVNAPIETPSETAPAIPQQNNTQDNTESNNGN